MTDTGLDLVTGAFSYTGRHIAARLLAAGRRVRTLTGHPERPSPFAPEHDVEAFPLAFDDPSTLVGHLLGVSTLYNTYWVRFERGGVTFDQAVENSRTLFQAAAEAGVARIVHVSITKPSVDSPLPYFRGKGLVEQALGETGVSHAIVRPTVVFSEDDVLVNNIAWLLRYFLVFPLAGDGQYRVRPVHVDDLAQLCVEQAAGGGNVAIDAVGPEVLTFETLVRTVRDAVGSWAVLVRVPPAVVELLAEGISRVVGDVLLTRDELTGLMGELVTTDGPATGSTVFTEWVKAHGDRLGRNYASELKRHFDGRPAA